YRCAQRGGRSHLHSALGHGVAARHIELIDTPVRVALDPDDLIELSRVEIDRGRSSSWRGRREWGLADGKGIMNNRRHPGRIAMTSDMHVECRGARAKQVIMYSGDFKPAFDHLEHDRIDFVLQQYQV